MADEFADEATARIESIIRTLSTNGPDANIFECSTNKLSALLRNSRRMSARFPMFEGLCDVIVSVMTLIENSKRELRPCVGFIAARKTATRGRPLYVIGREQLEYLVEAGFSRKTIASLLQVSDSVVKRRLRLYSIRLRGTYASISNDDLDDLVRNITKDNSSLGQRMVQGILQSQGIRVQRQRLADSLIRVDEAAVAMRWCRSIRRRVYKVAGPNSLWHIDGNHKLIRWGFVIHGGVDGYSRLCVFLQAAVDNRATTMSRAFMAGTERYGVPSRVRSDHGLENTGVGAFMIAHRGSQRGSFITGRSVHNQRIERLWRDMFASCTSVFHRLFHHMEETGQMYLDNPIHLWCLHFVFLPRIQKALDVFREGWNCHRLSEERGKSPTQLYIEGMVRQAGQGHRGVDDMVFDPQPEVVEDPNTYGIDEEAPAALREEEPTVSSVQSPISLQAMVELRNHLSTLEDNDLGVESYLESVRFCIETNNNIE